MQSGTFLRFQRGCDIHACGPIPINVTAVEGIIILRGAPERVPSRTGHPRNNSNSSPFPLMKEKSSKVRLEPWTGITDQSPVLQQKRTERPRPRRNGPPPDTKSGATLIGGAPDQVWEGGKRNSHLDAQLMDEDWRQEQPHQRTPVKFALLGLLLEASGYEETGTRYLVDGFRLGFHLRLDRPIDQLTSDRMRNKRTVEGNNKTALSNPQAVEAKLENELLARLGASFPGLRHLTPWLKEEESPRQVQGYS